MPRLLLVDDDIELCAMLRDYLQGEGFDVDIVHDGISALKFMEGKNPDLIVLDIMMPAMDGLNVLAKLRSNRQTPVLMLTARGEDQDSILGLELGADDYLPKPCNPKVLTARLRAILRRSEIRQVADVLVVGDLSIHVGSRRVLVGEQEVVMTGTEFSVLELLVRDPGRVVSKSQLSELALGRPLGPFDRSVDMHVSNLRHKLGPFADGRERIKAIRGVGYLYLQN